jgi:tetratricopeptide (TPR) repeat protein/GTPase SAR1 family protein
MNERHPNPYVVGTPLTGPYGFFGREEVIQLVRETFSLPRQNVIVLYGQRRTGKTSLLHQLKNNLLDAFRPVIFDLQGRAKHSLARVLHDLAQAIAKVMDLPAPSEAQLVRTDYFQAGFLPKVFDQLGNTRLLLLFDEFDVLGDEPLETEAARETLFPYLQTLITQEPRLGFIFVVGRRVDQLPVHYRSIFKQAVFQKLSYLRRDEAIQLITQPVASILDYQPAAVDAILDLTAGHPYLTQLICHVLFNRLQRDGISTVTSADVERVVDKALEVGTGALDWFWEGLPRSERVVLAAIAEVTNGDKPATEEQILQMLHEYRIRLLGAELTSAPQRLVDWEIIHPVGSDGFRCSVELVRRWIVKEHPLSRAKQDIDLVSPRATRYYKNARDAHLSGDLPVAIDDYRRALAVNPNHSAAQLGLAQALHESGQSIEAIAEYEKAYKLDPIGARDGLIAVRLDHGKSLQHNGQVDKAIAEYKRILAVAPADEEAQQRLIDIWLTLGETLLAKDNLKTATKIYRQALETLPDNKTLIAKIKEEIHNHVQEAREDWTVAYESLTHLADLLPGDPEVEGWVDAARRKWRAANYYHIAREAFSVGDLETALEECRRAIAENGFAAAQVLLAQILYERGALSEAVTEYERAFEMDSAAACDGLVTALLAHAHSLETANHVERATAAYERVLEVRPKTPEAASRLLDIWTAQGDKHLARDNLGEAITAYKQAQAVAPSPEPLVAHLKSVFKDYSDRKVETDHWSSSIDALVSLRSELGVVDGQIQAWLAQVHLDQGHAYLSSAWLHPAADAYRQALAIRPSPTDTAAFERQFDLPPIEQVRSALREQSQTHSEQQELAQAVQTLTVLAELLPDDSQVRTWLIEALVAQGDACLATDQLDEAAASFQQVLDLHPDDAEIEARQVQVAKRRRELEIASLHRQAENCMASQDWDEAANIYQRLVSDFEDPSAGPLLRQAQDEIHLAGLFDAAMAAYQAAGWDDAIAGWFQVYQDRSDYASKSGEKAAVWLAKAIMQREGITAQGEQAAAATRRQLQIAWALVIILALALIGTLAYAWSNGWLGMG